MKRIQNIEFYPFIFAVYPTLALLGHNIEEIKPVVSERALLITLLVITIIFGVLVWLLKEDRKSVV